MTAAHDIRTLAETNLKMINNAYTETYIQHSKLTAMLSICLTNMEEYYYYILFIFLCLARPPLISKFYNSVVACPLLLRVIQADFLKDSILIIVVKTHTAYSGNVHLAVCVACQLLAIESHGDLINSYRTEHELQSCSNSTLDIGHEEPSC